MQALKSFISNFFVSSYFSWKWDHSRNLRLIIKQPSIFFYLFANKALDHEHSGFCVFSDKKSKLIWTLGVFIYDSKANRMIVMSLLRFWPGSSVKWPQTGKQWPLTLFGGSGLTQNPLRTHFLQIAINHRNDRELTTWGFPDIFDRLMWRICFMRLFWKVFDSREKWNSIRFLFACLS